MSQDESEDETQSRAERLTDRRSRSRERTLSQTTENDTDTSESDNQTGQRGQTAQTKQTGEAGQPKQNDQTEQSGDSEEDERAEWSQTGDENVKRENKPLYMYLDQRLRDTVEDLFEDVRYYYRKSYDVELQKNRHVYPLVLEHGIGPIREMADSPADVRNALEANPYTPVIPAEVDADASEDEPIGSSREETRNA